MLHTVIVGVVISSYLICSTAVVVVVVKLSIVCVCAYGICVDCCHTHKNYNTYTTPCKTKDREKG